MKLNRWSGLGRVIHEIQTRHSDRNSLKEITVEKFLWYAKETVRGRLAEVRADITSEEFELFWDWLVKTHYSPIWLNRHPLNHFKEILIDSPIHNHLVSFNGEPHDLTYLFLEPLRKYKYPKD